MGTPQQPDQYRSGHTQFDPDRPDEAAARRDAASSGQRSETETVTEPAKLIRIASMAHQVLDELHQGGFGDAARSRVDTAYNDSLEELRSVLSDDLRRELGRLAAPFEPAEPGSSPPPQSELRVAEAQLAGWLEGLIQGVQASVATQQVAEDQQAQHAQQQPQAPTPQDRHRYR